MFTILIVDDEAPVRKMLRSMLNADNVELLEATNGNEALKVINESDIDLLITDIVMPEKHGIDLIMEIKKSSAKLPVIAISGGGGITGRFDYLEIAKVIGAENILKKPFTADTLRGLVNEYIAKKSVK
ncbi:MAG: response regulator [Gammaproteobacteria bacterium]|nr:response regulator [Gammaproteobacteria bacterium]